MQLVSSSGCGVNWSHSGFWNHAHLKKKFLCLLEQSIMKAFDD